MRVYTLQMSPLEAAISPSVITACVLLIVQRARVIETLGIAIENEVFELLNFERVNLKLSRK